MLLHADSVNSYQTGRMPRLISIFVVRTSFFFLLLLLLFCFCFVFTCFGSFSAFGTRTKGDDSSNENIHGKRTELVPFKAVFEKKKCIQSAVSVEHKKDIFL